MCRELAESSSPMKYFIKPKDAQTAPFLTEQRLEGKRWGIRLHPSSRKRACDTFMNSFYFLFLFLFFEVFCF